MSDDYHNTSTLHATVTKVLLGLVLLSSVGALVLTGNSSTLREGVSSANIAKIGDKSISAQEFSQIYSRRIAQNNIPDEMARKMGVPQMILQSEIEHETMLQAAKKLGIRIDDKYIAEQLTKQLEQIKADGTPKEKLQMILRQQKLTEGELVASLRGDYSINVLASTVTTNDLNVPEGLLVNAYQAKKQKRSAEITYVTAETLKDRKPLTQEQLEAYYKENNNTYRIEEKRDISALVLPQKIFLKEVTVSEDEAKKYYNENPSQFMSPERVQMEQVILPDEAAAKKIIDAKPHDLSAYKTQQYIKADWYSKKTLPKELLNVVYPSQAKGIIGPVKTPLGWHVLNVTTYEDAKPESFESAKSAIEHQLKDVKIDDQMTAATNELDAMIAGGSSLADIAKKYKLEPVSVSGLQAKKAADQMKQSSIPMAVQQRIQDALFTMQANEISPLMDTPDGDNVIFQVTKVTPASTPELKTIETQIRADADKAGLNKALLTKAEELVGVYDPKDQSKLDKAISNAKLKTEAVEPMTHDELSAKFDKQFGDLLFTLSPDNRLSYVQYPDKVVLVRLKNIVSDKEKPDAKTLDGLKDALKTSMVQELQQQFMQAWQKELGVSVNETLFQNDFGPQSKEPAAQ
jgi:peptidyl-prolyl cis-trans isomerase D